MSGLPKVKHISSAPSLTWPISSLPDVTSSSHTMSLITSVDLICTGKERVWFHIGSRSSSMVAVRMVSVPVVRVKLEVVTYTTACIRVRLGGYLTCKLLHGLAIMK